MGLPQVRDVTQRKSSAADQLSRGEPTIPSENEPLGVCRLRLHGTLMRTAPQSRETHSRPSLVQAACIPNAPSRGELTRDFLEGALSPLAYLQQVHTAAVRYNGFNLVVGDLRSLEVRESPSGQKPCRAAGKLLVVRCGRTCCTPTALIAIECGSGSSCRMFELGPSLQLGRMRLPFSSRTCRTVATRPRTARAYFRPACTV